jgi:hypothetical protein
MRKLRDAHKDLSDQKKFVLAMTLYNEASTYAVEGKQDKALATLNEAIDAGFSDLGRLDENEELGSLRKSPNFQFIKEKLLVRVREHLLEMLAENKPFKFDFKLPDLKDKERLALRLQGEGDDRGRLGTWCPPLL